MYHYFESKDEVFFEVARSEEAILASVVRIVVDAVNVDDYIELLVTQ